MANPNLVVVFVPGGMGTKLSLHGATVWDFNPNLLSLNLDGVRMITDPALLLPWLPLEHEGLLSTYDNLIAFLHGKGYTEGNQNLYLFGYDWRQGIPALANQLTNFVNGIAGNRKVLFICHSYGCMIVRWALTVPPSSGGLIIKSNIVQGVVAAGPPMLGMASAFRDTLQMPSMGNALDSVWSLLQTFHPGMADQIELPLCKSLATVTAELEGIPLNSFPILQGGTKASGLTPYGAFDWGGWPDSLQTLLDTVQQNLAKLQASNWGTIDVSIIASKNFPTDTGYTLKSDDTIDSAWPAGYGDGSVLLTSAKAFCPGNDPLLVSHPHESLLDDHDATNFIAPLIQ